MRSYGQYCALARALDVIGERWSMLIVRELFARDSRYSDLRDALPGIATNLLAARLRHLQDHGVVEAYVAPPPVRATVYRLTPRGRQLAPVLAGLVAWGAALLDRQGTDVFRMQWLALGLPVLFRDVDVSDISPLRVAVRAGDEEPATLAVGPEGVTVAVGEPTEPVDVTVSGPPDGVFALLSGADRAPDGVRTAGPADAVERLHRLAGRCSRS